MDNDEFIKWLQKNGLSRTITTDQRELMASLGSEFGAVLVAAVDAQSSQKSLAQQFNEATDPAEKKRLGDLRVEKGVTNLKEVFGGQLIETEPHLRLTELGRSLASFFATALDCGFSSMKTRHHLGAVTDDCLNVMQILAKWESGELELPQ